MTRHLIWAGAAALSIAALSHYNALYNIEEVKQRVFIMKACIDAGGQWKNGWGYNNWYCILPEKPK